MSLDYLTLEEVLTIHDDLIDRYGGSYGVRDYGQIEAALFRPQTGYYADAVEEAAALWESLSQNHGFIDGNKRVAFACTYTFLKINGFKLKASHEDVWGFLEKVYATREVSFNVLEAWLRNHIEEI